MCGIAGFISHKKVRENGERIKKGIILQNDRGNGFGAGFAAYGIYPHYRDFYALHVMAAGNDASDRARDAIEGNFLVHHREEIPVWEKAISDHPLFIRYFVKPGSNTRFQSHGTVNEDDYIIERIMQINSQIEGAFIFSSGKNMGVFKGVGTPEDIYNFFRLDDYEGYTWLAHNRFPTNTPGWWGGAHPFNLLGLSIVHNGELSSYGINRRYLEAFGYICNMQTDSEAVAYLLDLLIRKHGLSIVEATMVLAPPYWSQIDRMEDEELQDRLTAIKIIYESAMLTGPFAILSAFDGGLFSITDNTKLRPLTAGHAPDYSYFASEVSALYEMEEGIEKVITPRAGQPCIVQFAGEEPPGIQQDVQFFAVKGG
jgi:glutamate synthase domain-containing protein 1